MLTIEMVEAYLEAILCRANDLGERLPTSGAYYNLAETQLDIWKEEGSLTEDEMAILEGGLWGLELVYGISIKEV